MALVLLAIQLRAFDKGLQQYVMLQYNGCKWLGGVLRVEKAKAHHLTRLQTEWEVKSEPQDQIAGSITANELSIQEDPMRIATPASGFVKRKVSQKAKCCRSCNSHCGSNSTTPLARAAIS